MRVLQKKQNYVDVIYSQPLMLYANNPLEEIISFAVGEESLNKLNLQAGGRGDRLAYCFILHKVKTKITNSKTPMVNLLKKNLGYFGNTILKYNWKSIFLIFQIMAKTKKK